MAFPLFVLAMAMVAALGNRVENIIYATAIINLPFYIRFARAEINVRRNPGWVEAARACGDSHFSVVLRFLLPNVLPAMAVQISLNLGWAILNAAGLSFIGLGVQPPTPEWGIMVAEGARFISTGKWWLVAFPGLALMLTVLCFNLLGDGLRDMLDPPHAVMTGDLLPHRGSACRLRDESWVVEALRGVTISVGGRNGRPGRRKQVGQSVTGFAATGLLDGLERSQEGRILFRGQDLTRLRRGDFRHLQGAAVSMIFQNPRAALNPIRAIGEQVSDAFRPRGDIEGRGTVARSIYWAPSNSRSRGAHRAFPHELSGGMCQRVMIAIAISCNPALLIADEPTTGLDVTTQKVVMDLLADIAAAADGADSHYARSRSGRALLPAHRLMEQGRWSRRRPRRCFRRRSIPIRGAWLPRRRPRHPH